MPQRATSRAMGYGGVALVLMAASLVVGPVLWRRPNLAKRLKAENAELDRITKPANRIRDVTDTLPKKSDRVADRMLADRARDAALQEAGPHDDAVTARNIGSSRELLAGIEDITRERSNTRRDRYQDTVNDIRTATDVSDQSAGIMFALAGALFALGCAALMTYLRRHLTAEVELRAARDAALEASVIKTRFITTASHDLRQPLHAISMFVGVLRRRSHDPAVLEVVENVASAVASMQRMFTALLDVARLDAGAVKVERRSVALQGMFNALGIEFTASAVAKGLLLQIQPTPFSVEADPASLETILRNLLSNAIKFTDQGLAGITTRRRGPVVDIIVFDTGIGVAAKDQATIFGQFERLGQSGSAREGLGLGLSIVQRMADLLAVTVALESRPGGGSRFTLSLPFADPAPTAVCESAEPEAEPELRGYRILVLDDHPEARKAIVLAIETLGAVPLEAASLAGALSCLAAMAPEAPHAAVVDHDLGGGQTGPDFLDAYGARTGQALPAVIITGSTEARVLAILAAGGRPWLIKPVDFDLLRLTLSGLINPATAV